MNGGYLPDEEAYKTKSEIAEDFHKLPYDSPLLKLKHISEDETKELITQMREAEKAGKYRTYVKLRNKIVEGYMWLVNRVARGYSYRCNRDISDLVDEGSIGMIYSLGVYDLKKAKLGTYAPYWIKASISREVIGDSVIRRPVHVTERYKKIRDDPMKIGNGNPKKLLKEAEKRIQILEAYNKCNSVLFVDGYHDKDDTSLKEHVRVAMRNEQRERIQEAMEKNLTFRERQIMMYYYGLDEKYGEQTLDELGKIYNLTREGVRLVKEKAIKKLRKPKVRINLAGL
jgi:RNA polymerase sigma factor (sigma-70 family)